MVVWRGVMATLVLGGVMASGCSGPKDFDNENDALRREREELFDEVRRLEAELGEANSKIDELSAVLAGTGEGPTAEVLGALPRCAGIEIDRLSGVSQADAEMGERGVVRVYVRPFDGRQRFVQVAGRMIVEARLIPLAREDSGRGAPEAAGVLLGRVDLGPEALRESYRSGVTGTHYSVEVVPDWDVRVLDGAVVISAVFLDAVTGRRHEAWRVVRTGR